MCDYNSTLNQMHCLRIERLEELLAYACKERDELRQENMVLRQKLEKARGGFDARSSG